MKDRTAQPRSRGAEPSRRERSVVELDLFEYMHPGRGLGGARRPGIGRVSGSRTSGKKTRRRLVASRQADGTDWEQLDFFSQLSSSATSRTTIAAQRSGESRMPSSLSAALFLSGAGVATLPASARGADADLGPLERATADALVSAFGAQQFWKEGAFMLVIVVVLALAWLGV